MTCHFFNIQIDATHSLSLVARDWEAFDDAARKYYDETPMKDRSDNDVIAAMRAMAKTKHHTFKGQFFKYLSIANPKFGDKFLQEVGLSFMTPLLNILIQYWPSIDIP